MFLLLDDNWFFLDGFEVKFFSACKIIILVIIGYYLSSEWLFDFVLLLSYPFNEWLIDPIQSIHGLFLIINVIGLL